MTDLNIKEIVSRVEKLEKEVFGKKNTKIQEEKSHKDDKINYKLNIKAFEKRYVTNKMSGPKKFTLILSYLAKGKVDEEIDIKHIKKIWNKKLGEFNDSYTNLAQSRGWVDSKSRGVYCLTDEWKNIF